jgi:CRISPR-associated protein Cas2
VFVAVCIELADEDTRQAVRDLVVQYGFRRVFGDLYECTTMPAERLGRVKKDIDRVTNSYDRVRFYQYPIDDTLVITDLKQKKWRRQKIIF